MSAKQTGLVWELDLPHNEAWVLMALADHADHEGQNVYPGVPLLAWKTGYTTRQVRRVLAQLQQKGLIVAEEPGGGRRTTRYRLELSEAPRKAPRSSTRAGTQAELPAAPTTEDIMSPLAEAPGSDTMSPQPGQNVRGARTQPCHPNRHGTNSIEPFNPPPSNLPPPALGGTPASEGSDEEGGRELETNREEGDDGSGLPSQWVAEIRAAYAGCTWLDTLPAAQRAAVDRQVERLIRGQDAEAWTSRRSGARVPEADRPRIFRLALGYVDDGTSRSLRGGIMYAVAKHGGCAPHVPGTEHAGVLALGSTRESPGSDRVRRPAPTAPVRVSAELAPSPPHGGEAGDPVLRWECEHPEESARLRDEVARQLAADAGSRRVSDRMLRLMGQAEYGRRVEELLTGGAIAGLDLRSCALRRLETDLAGGEATLHAGKGR